MADHDEHEPEHDPTETIDAVYEIREFRQRELAAGIPDLAGFALIVASGPRRGLHWTLREGETRAGRDPMATVFLDDVTVSRNHAAFVLDEGALWVQDLGSTNGTYVNGSRQERAQLNPGDEVIIGRFHLVVARGG